MVNRVSMNCEQVWPEISNYVDGDVEAGLRASMDEHFRTCQKCASVLAGTRNVVKLYGDERMLEVPAGFGRRLEKRLTQKVAMKESRRPNWSTWLVPLAAMALIAGILLMMNSSRNGSALRSQHAEQAKDIPPDMVVVVSSGAKLFHVPGCKFIHDKATERTLTAKEAMRQGYVPCPRCLRQYLKTGLTHEGGAQVAEGTDTDTQEDEIEPAEVLSTPGK